MKLFEVELRLKYIDDSILYLEHWLSKDIKFSLNDINYFTLILDELISERGKLSYIVDKVKVNNKFDKTATIRQAELYKKGVEDRIKLNDFTLMSKVGEIDISDYIKKSIELRDICNKIDEQILTISLMLEVDIS